jgi:Na+/melibiose symporter-like transporter
MFTLATITGLFPETRTNMVCFVFIAICGAIASFGQALYYQVLTISVSNTVEYNDLKTGSRDEGMIFAVRPFMAKMGSSFVKAVETITLTALAVIPITSAIAVYDQQKGAGDITQAEFEELVNSALNGAPDYVHFALMAVMAIVPILLVLGSFILYMKKYKIDEKEYDRICEEIRLRDQGAQSGECTCHCEDGECHCDCEDGECHCDCDDNCDDTCECHCHCHEDAPQEEVFEEVAAESTTDAE